MKKKIFISILFLSSLSFTQTVDSTKWILKTIDSLDLSFEYPSYFDIGNLVYEEEPPIDEITFAVLDFVYYSELGKASEYTEDEDTSRILYLTQPSQLSLIISGKSFIDIGDEYGYTIKDSLWFDTDMLENGWSNEPAKVFNFNDWIGYYTYTPARIYIKDGGCWTAAGEEQRIIAMKHINNNKNIFAIAEGFDFPEGEIILQIICKSILIK